MRMPLLAQKLMDSRYIRESRSRRPQECCLRDGAFLVRQDLREGSMDIGNSVLASASNWLTRAPMTRWAITGGRETGAVPRFVLEARDNDPSIYVDYGEKRMDSRGGESPGAMVDSPYSRRAWIKAADE